MFQGSGFTRLCVQGGFRIVGFAYFRPKGSVGFEIGVPESMRTLHPEPIIFWDGP